MVLKSRYNDANTFLTGLGVPQMDYKKIQEAGRIIEDLIEEQFNRLVASPRDIWFEQNRYEVGENIPAATFFEWIHDLGDTVSTAPESAGNHEDTMTGDLVFVSRGRDAAQLGIFDIYNYFPVPIQTYTINRSMPRLIDRDVDYQKIRKVSSVYSPGSHVRPGDRVWIKDHNPYNRRNWEKERRDYVKKRLTDKYYFIYMGSTATSNSVRHTVSMPY